MDDITFSEYGTVLESMRKMSAMSFTLVALVCRAKSIYYSQNGFAHTTTHIMSKFLPSLYFIVHHLFLSLTLSYFHPLYIIAKRFSVILCHWNRTEKNVSDWRFPQFLYKTKLHSSKMLTLLFVTIAIVYLFFSIKEKSGVLSTSECHQMHVHTVWICTFTLLIEEDTSFVCGKNYSRFYITEHCLHLWEKWLSENSV